MKSKKTVIFISSVFLSLLLFLYLDFAGNVSGYRENAGKADAIVVLTGGLGRIDKGLELFNKKRADYLVIAGVDKDATIESIFFKRDIGFNAGKIILEKGSTSTYENAIAITGIIEAMDMDSIILITSFYHMQRASYIFHRMLPSGIKVLLHPVTTENFDEKAWWRGRGPALLALEFLKFYWYRLWI